MIQPDTILIGHDLGGVVAALAALQRPPRQVVLSGTALGPYWAMVRATAAPVLWRYFYQRHAGRRFVAGAVAPERSAEALAAFPGADPSQMRAIALGKTPPPRLAQRLAAVCPVRLIWGRQDRWYPPWVARALSRATGAPITWIDAGHLAMWEAPRPYAAALRALLSSDGAG